MSNKKRPHESVDYIKQDKEKIPAGEYGTITTGIERMSVGSREEGGAGGVGNGGAMGGGSPGSMGRATNAAGSVPRFEQGDEGGAAAGGYAGRGSEGSFTELGSSKESDLMPPGNQWTASVVRWKIAKDEQNKQFATYLLQMTPTDASKTPWFLFRRYTDFSNLKVELKKHGCAVSNLPSKGVFNFSSHFSSGT